MPPSFIVFSLSFASLLRNWWLVEKQLVMELRFQEAGFVTHWASPLEQVT